MATVYKRNGKGPWWVSWTNEHGQRKAKSARTTDKRAAERIAAKLEADAQLRSEGVIDARADRFAIEARKPLKEHIVDYEAACDDAGQAAHTIATKVRCLQALARKLEAKVFRDLTVEGVSHAIASMKARHRDGKDKGGKPQWREAPASARTKNASRATVMAFANWMQKTGRIESHPFGHLPKADESSDRRKVRRALTDDELRRLLDVARRRDAERNADPKNRHGRSTRAAWYTAAALAGLRRGDLVRLSWGDVDFDDGSITVRDGKAKREDVLPLHPELAAELHATRCDERISGNARSKDAAPRVTRDFAAQCG